MLDANHCANCGRTIDTPEQKFCPDCGQPTPVHRIDWHFLGHELEHGVLHVDRGFLFTLKGLFLRPGHFIREYLQGRRGGHVKPVPMLVMGAALVTVLAHYLVDGDVLGSSFTEGFAQGMDNYPGTNDASASRADTARVLEAFTGAKAWMNRHLALVTLLLLPFQALVFKLAFRRLRTINYPEWLVITTYLTVQTFMVMAIGVLAQARWPDAHMFTSLVAIAFNVFTLVQFFNDYPRWKSLLRALFGFFVFTFFIAGVVPFTAAPVLALRAP